MAVKKKKEEEAPTEARVVKPEFKLFGRYDCDAPVQDVSLGQYVCLKPVDMPHSFARHANKQFAKRHVNIVERLANKLMRGGTGKKIGGRIIRTHGSLQGKKTTVLRVMREAFEKIEARTKQNPVHLLVKALENSAPAEDVTRVRFGGTSYQQSVDVSAQRRLDLALRNLATAAIMSAFNKKATLADALADEIVLASQNSPDSYSIKRRNETERVARSAR
ncbi:MAG: 30S ribosomal protein S7 [Candidatus Micrarchaeia archaeon]